MKPLPLHAILGLLLTGALHATPPNPEQVPDRANWFLHADLDESIPHPVATVPPSAHDAGALWNTVRAHLKPVEFTALWLFYREDLPLKDIARTLRKSPGNTKVILHRARTRLRDHLHPEHWRPDASPATPLKSLP